MHPTVDLGWVELDSYTALVGLGVLAGLLVSFLYLYWRSRRTLDWTSFLHLAVFVLVFGWVGARAYHILTHWEYYQARPEEITSLGAGGLAIRGALVTGLAALAVYRALFGERYRRISFARLLDSGALGLALGQAIGWAGALVRGANYGVVSDAPFALDLPDIYGLDQVRFPLQHAEILFLGLLFIGLGLWAWQRPPAGMIFSIYLLVSSLGNGLLEFQRGDEALFVGSLRVDQMFDVAFVLMAAGLAAYFGRRWKRSVLREPALSFRGSG